MSRRIVQFAKFVLVGCSNVLVSLMIYYVLLEQGVPYLMATFAGYIISTVTGYFLNRFWVFHPQKIRTGISLMRYYFVYLSALGINLSLMYLFVDHMLLPAKLAPILILFVTIPYNFILSKLWVYKEDSHYGKNSA